MSLPSTGTGPLVPVRFDLRGAHQDGGGDEPVTDARMRAIRAQLEHLFPAAPFPLHVGFGPPPAGYRTLDAWRAVPGPGAPRVLLPLRPAAARAAVLSHNGLRPPRVAATRMLAAAAVGPLARLRGEDGVLRLSAPREVDDEQAAATVITRHLRALVPGAHSSAISLRDFHPRAKPTIALLATDGTVLAFAKVASDPTTGERVSTEAGLLAELGARPADPVLANTPVLLPRLVAQGRCGPFTYSVVEPLPGDVRRVAETDRDRVLRPLLRLASALGGPQERALGTTTLWREVMHRVDSAQGARPVRPDLVIGLNQLVAVAEGSDAGTVLPCGVYHGDWVPWNMAWSAAGTDGPRLWVWDLEYGSRSGPLGLDALRWEFQVEHVVRRRSLSAAVAAARTQAPHLLRALGVPVTATEALLRLHVVETMATALTLLAQGRGLPEGLDPDAVDVMRAVRRGAA